MGKCTGKQSTKPWVKPGETKQEIENSRVG